ncbi:MAG: SIS domain-containing protein [Bdellovibrionota bacterium]
MDSKNFVFESLKESVKSVTQSLETPELHESVGKAIDWIAESYMMNGKLLTAGNGGSAADAQHISAEMVGKLTKDRTSLPAIAFNVDTSLLTAVGNDYGYDEIFHRQVQGLGESKDIFLGITTSGNSRNIIRALEACREKSLRSIVLTGPTGGEIKSKGLADLVICAPGKATAMIQECHIMLYHIICFGVEKQLLEKGRIKFF